jgi:hypothetical protein
VVCGSVWGDFVSCVKGGMRMDEGIEVFGMVGNGVVERVG